MQEPPQPLPTSRRAPDPPPLPDPGGPGPRPPAAGGGDEGWRELLHNRFILGGLGVLVVLLLTTIVLVAVGGGNDENGNTVAVKTGTPGAQSTVLPTEGLPGHTRQAVTMYNGPDQTYAIVGLIPKGATVSVIGRSGDSSWLQVYPPGSKLPGWILASAVDVEGNVSQLTTASPGEGPDIAVPTSGVPVEEQPDFIYTPEEIETPEPTAEATEPPVTQRPATRTPRPRTATPPPGRSPTPRATVTRQ